MFAARTNVPVSIGLFFCYVNRVNFHCFSVFRNSLIPEGAHRPWDQFSFFVEKNIGMQIACQLLIFVNFIMLSLYLLLVVPDKI